jgi:hypothetical protein
MELALAPALIIAGRYDRLRNSGGETTLSLLANFSRSPHSLPFRIMVGWLSQRFQGP